MFGSFKEVARVNLDSMVDVVVSVGEVKGEELVDVRQFIRDGKYEGFTKKGIRFPKDKFEELIKFVGK